MNHQEPAILNDNKLEEELLVIWRKALDNDKLTIDDDFFEAGGDSLLATQALMEIEELTGKSLPPSIIFETGTVRLLLKRMTATDEFKPRVSFMTGPVDGKLIHFFHGDFEWGGAYFKPFSKTFVDDYLIHAIAPHLPHEGKLPDSIEDMAKERLSQILEKQPDGPYIILGNCNGALVGFEAARQLVLMGKEVKAVVMIDPLIMSVRRSAQFIFITTDFFMRLIGVDKSNRRITMFRISDRLLWIDKQTKDFGRRLFFFFQKTWPEKRSSLEKFLEIYGILLHPKKLIHKLKNREYIIEDIAQHYKNAIFEYNPLPLNVAVLYISLEFSGYAWRRITRNTVYMNIYRGNHLWSGEKYAQDVVDKIRGFINR